MSTLCFEASDEDDLRKMGFSKDGKHHDPQILIGLLVGLGGYAIGYDCRGKQHQHLTRCMAKAGVAAQKLAVKRKSISLWLVLWAPSHRQDAERCTQASNRAAETVKNQDVRNE